MSKTPEEMAEEYCSTTGWLEDDYVWRETEAGFLAGYKAAKDQQFPGAKPDKVLIDEPELVADVSKVMCSTTMEEIKAVDTGEIISITNLPKPAKWISVKDRLPEEHVWVLGYYSRYKHEETFVVGLVQRYVHSWAGATIWMTDIVDGALSYEEVQSITHWMPLPAPPKEEK